jgi:hypothetical protein
MRPQAVTAVDTQWVTVHVTGPGSRLQALIEEPTLTILVRPDRVIAAATTRARVPRLPWTAPAATRRETATT